MRLLMLLVAGTVCAFAAAPGRRATSPPTPAPSLPELEKRLAKWKSVEMPFDASRLAPKERQMLEILVSASRDIENIFWRQDDPDAIPLYRSLEGATTPRDQTLRRLLWIHGGRFDRITENEPFVGKEPAPPGRALYPSGMTREKLEQYVKAHPEQRKDIYDPFTIVVRRGERLATIPYRVAYRRWLEPAAGKLRDAAALSEDARFSRYLRLRADALLSDDYYASDLAWLELENPRFDVIFAPYETYLDGVLGVKTSYGAAVMVRNEEESAKLARYQALVPDIQDALPLPAADRPSKRGKTAPMEVMDTPFRSGDLRHGYQAVADNLPNDPRVHEQKGSKRIFFKNFMDARVREVVLPLGRRLMREDQAAKASADGYLTVVLMHEICHGLGPAYARRGSGKTSIREVIGPVFAGLEEAKADATGLFGLAWLAGRGDFPRERMSEVYASYLAGIFRTVRFGTAEAHGRAEMMQFNVLFESGAIRREASGRYAFDEAALGGAIAKLAQELLEIEATGDRARAEAWFRKYEKMPPDLRAALDSASDVPVDFDPQGSFPEGVE